MGHPAPFPVELPYRCIQLYTFKGEVVLDPFVGAGTTAIAALMAGRRYKGVRQKAHDFNRGMNAVNKFISINSVVVKYEISTRQN